MARIDQIVTAKSFKKREEVYRVERPPELILTYSDFTCEY